MNLLNRLLLEDQYLLEVLEVLVDQTSPLILEVRLYLEDQFRPYRLWDQEDQRDR